MSGIKVDKLDLIWSPHHNNRFISVGNDIHLYEIEDKKNNKPKLSAISIGNGYYANLLATCSDYPHAKCVSWYPKPHHGQLLAIGSTSGKVVLNSFSENIHDFSGFTTKEFKPKQNRPCFCVAWNPNDCKLFAHGLDKHRYDHGLYVWDVTRNTYSTVDSTIHEKRSVPHGFSTEQSGYAKPVVELGYTESTQSLHWFNHNAQLIVCGMNNKHIKIYDLRDASKHQNSTPTKAVHHVCIDPYFEHRLASVFENLFVLWDIRNFEKPVVTTHEQKQIQKICWCPTRPSLLAALIKENNFIKLYDIQSSMGNDDIEPTVVERCIRPFDNGTMSFAWHPTQENRMMTISNTNNFLDYIVFDRITLNWSPTSEIVWTCGKKLLMFVDNHDKFYECLEDISVTMRKRAVNEYGLNMTPVWMNGILSEDPGLLGVWVWLDLVKTHPLLQKPSLKGASKFRGVHTIICGENGSFTLSVSKVQQMPWIGLNSTIKPMYKYVSPERESALQLCGWGSQAESSQLSNFLERLECEKKQMRGAAISIFCLDVKRAIDILNQSASRTEDATELNTIAMALAGFTDDKSSLWRKISRDLKSKLRDPHLRVMFAFLTVEGDNFDEILNEPEIAVQDKLAIALLYLPDKKLADYLKKLKKQMLDIGSLDGILLTGLSHDGFALIQRYVDVTGDVQTASLIMLHTLSHEAPPLAKAWVESYRRLLDTWKLWKNRAVFDVQWFKTAPNESRPAQQIFVSCTFCGKSVANYFKSSGIPPSNTRYTQIASAQKAKVSCCPVCRKPMPRCSLCLSHMGTPSGLYWKRPGGGKLDKKLTEFSSWLSWCQTCRHGGHSVHILGWFESHTECPVTGCNCKCLALDSIAKLSLSEEKI